ncbi:MAG: CotH kinase family protein [Lachnospiraceae bacterium]|nr:CotH kinase family protein [Lachnospiraceae bacterium]
MICSQIIRNRSVSDKANSVKKKKYGGIIAAAVLGVLLMSAIVVLLVQRGTGPRLSQMSVEESSFSSIKDGRKEDPQMQCSLIFDDIELPADLTEGRWYYSLPEGVIAQPDPRVKIKGENGLKVAFLDTEVTEESIRESVPMEFIAYTDSSYFCGEIIMTPLPIIMMDFPEGGIAPDEKEKEDKPIHFQLIDNYGKETHLVTSDGNARLRGYTTRKYPKKPYHIEFGENRPDGFKKNRISLLDMREDFTWYLYPAYNDQERVRNVFSFMLWEESCGTDNAFGIDTSITYRYTEVLIDGRYAGLFAICCPPDEKSLGIKDKGSVYKASSNNSGLQVNDNLIGFSPDGRVYGFSERKTVADGTIDTEYWSPVLSYYEEFYNSRNDNEALRSIMDVDNAIDYHLFTNLTQGVDNIHEAGFTNRYEAVWEEDGEWHILMIPWDLDLTWGNRQKNEADLYDVPPDENVLSDDGPLHQVLVNGDPEIKNEIVEKYQTLRADAWSDEKVSGLLDRLEAQIYGSGAFKREIERWPDSNHNDPETGLDDFRVFVSERFAYLDSYYGSADTAADIGSFLRTTDSLDTVFVFETFNDPALFSNWFPRMQGSVLLIQVNDKAIWADEEFAAFAGALGITEAERLQTPDLIVMESGKSDRTVVQDYWTNGDTAETPLGMLAYYEGDSGYYGLYLDGKQCYSDTIASKNEEPVRLIVYTPAVCDEGDYFDSQVMDFDF